MDENIAVLAIELTPDDLDVIDSASSKITIQVARHPEELEQMTGRWAIGSASRNQDCKMREAFPFDGC